MTNLTTRARSRAFHGFVLLAFMACVAQLASMLLLDDTSTRKWVSTTVQLVVAMFTAVSCHTASRNAVGQMRNSWSLLAAGSAVYGLCQIVWALAGDPSNDGLGLTGMAGLPSTLFVPFGCFAFLALLTLPEGNAARALAFLDGIIIGVALMFATWMFALRAAMSGVVGKDALSQTLTFLQPTQDVVFMALGVLVLTTCRPKSEIPRVVVGLMVVGGAIYMVSQSYFSATNHNNFHPGTLLDCGWTGGLACFGLSARWGHAARRKRTDSRNYAILGQILPSAAVAIVLGLILSGVNSGRAFDFISLWLAACLIVCVLVRQVVTSVEDHRLGAMLEARVADRTQELSRREQQFRALVQHSSDVIVILGSEGKFEYVSPSIQYVLGHSPESLLHGHISDIVLPEDRTRVAALLAMATRRKGATMNAEWRVRRADGMLRQVEVLVRNLTEEPAVDGIVLNLRDVTERKELEDQLTHQALHDDLTGLANRSLLRMRIEQALARWLFQNEPFCLTVVDLDDFKSINDSLGHVAGDAVLRTLAERIGQCTRRGDTIVRLGSDEFAVLLEGVAAADIEAHNVARRIIEAVQEPMRIEGRELRMRASIGLACVTDQVSQADDIMRNADLALHTAKHSNRGHYVQFEVSMHDAALHRVELEGELRQALENDDLQLYYQPTMNIADAKLEGVEALLRWPHPTKGFVSPVDFIPIAEESGLIVQIGTWVLKQACNELAKWQGRYPSEMPLKMNVNLSGRQLDQPDIVEVVREVIESSGIRPGTLVLEMTESVLMENKRNTIEKMNALVELGCELAIDDFGTGYSSLSYLRQFPIAILKIDRSFVSGLGTGDRNGEAALVQAIVDLAKTLQLKTVAEGIETHEQLDELRRMGCEIGQGFLLARPAPAEEVRRLIEKTSAVGEPLQLAAAEAD